MGRVEIDTTSDLIRTSLDSNRFGWIKLIQTFFLVIGSVILVGLPFLVGYIFRVIQAAANGYEETPDLSDWGILTEGLWAILHLLPVLLIYLGLIVTAETFPFASTLAFLAFIFVCPSILIRYSLDREFSSLHPTTWTEFVKTKTYIKSFLLFIPIGIFLSFLAIIIRIAAIILLPYAILAAASYWGFVYYRWTKNN
jgi:hypothetical protein